MNIDDAQQFYMRFMDFLNLEGLDICEYRDTGCPHDSYWEPITLDWQAVEEVLTTNGLEVLWAEQAVKAAEESLKKAKEALEAVKK